MVAFDDAPADETAAEAPATIADATSAVAATIRGSFPLVISFMVSPFAFLCSDSLLLGRLERNRDALTLAVAAQQAELGLNIEQMDAVAVEDELQAVSRLGDRSPRQPGDHVDVAHVHGREDLGAGVLAHVHAGGNAWALVGRARGEVQVVRPDPHEYRTGDSAVGQPPR